MSSCPDEKNLQLFADGELAGVRRSRVAAHVKSCELCARNVQQLQRMGELVSSAIREETKGHDIATLWERVSAGIASPPARDQRRRWLISLVWTPAARVAYAAVVALLAGFLAVRPLLFPAGRRPALSRAKVHSVHQYNPEVVVSMMVPSAGESAVVWISGIGPIEEN